MGKIRKAVIPAAGYGTRFLPVTKAVPKELLPIGNKPAIQYVVEEAVEAGIEEIILVIHPSKEIIADYFRPDSSLNDFLEKRGKRKEREELKRIEGLAKFTVVYQREALGLGHAVLCAEKAVGDEEFVVSLPDRLVAHKTSGLRQLQEACEKYQKWGLLLEEVARERLSIYGIVGGKSLGGKLYRVETAVEKPRPEEAPSNLAIFGQYLFPPEIFKLIEGSKAGAVGEIQLTDAIKKLAMKDPGLGVVVSGPIFDVGIPQGLLEATQFFNSRP